MPKQSGNTQFDAENQELRARLEKAEATLREVLSGEADAMFVSGVDGAQLFTLKGADESYRALIENMSEGALILTPEGLILYANQRFAEMLKSPLEKVIGSEIQPWFALKSRQVIQTLLQKKAIDSYHEELNLAAADGTQVPTYLSVSRLVLGEIDSVCMVATDLTQQKRTEAILAAEKLSNAILEQAADAIVICDNNGRIIRASKQAQTVYGKNPVGQPFDQAFALRLLDGTAFSFTDSIDTEHSQSIEAMMNVNGREYSLLVSVGHLNGTENELLGSVVTLTDITELKTTELALEKSEQQLSEALTVAKIGYWEYEYSTDEFIFNDQYYLLHGITAEDVGGYRMSAADFASRYVYPEDAPMVAQQVQLAFESRDPDFSVTDEARILSGEGEIIWVEVRFRVKRDAQGNATHLLGINQDITERKQAEEEIRSISRFPSENPNPILRIQRNGTILYASQSAAPILTTWKRDVGQKVSNDWQKLITQSFESGINKEVEIESDGRTFSCILTPILTEEYVNIYGRDVTANKQAEKHLKLFRTLLDNSSDGIEVIDPVTTRFLDVNETECRELGYSREEMLSMSIADIDPSYDTALNKEIDEQMRKTGVARFESTHRRKDGSTFPVEVSSKLIELDKPYALNIVRNITERKQAEEHLKLFRTLIDLSSDFIEVVDPSNFRFLDINETECRVLGYSREEMLTMSIFDINPTMTPELAQKVREKCGQKGSAIFESVHQRKDGSTFPVEVQINLVEIDKPYLLNSVRDITERNKTETEIKFKNTMLQTQQETSLDAILVVDENAKIISYNQQFINMWKIPPQIVSTGLDAPVLKAVTDQVENPESFVAQVQYLYEHRDEKSHEEITLKDGRIIDRYSAPIIGVDSVYYGRVWYFRDITERKQAELALRTSELRFKTMFEQAPLGIALINSLNGQIHEVNTHFSDIAGRSIDEMLNIDWMQITHPDDVQADMDNMAQLNAGKINSFQMEKRYLRPDGTVVWINMTISPLQIGDKAHPRHLCMIQDITDRKKSEASIKYLNRVLSVLSGINTLIVHVNDRKELLREACNIAVKEGGFRMAMIVMVDPNTMLPITVTSAGKDEKLLADIKDVMSSSDGMKTTLVAQAMREKNAVIANDTQSDPRLLFGKQYAEAGVNSMLVLPLIISNEALGTLVFYASEAEFFHEEEMKLLTELAGDIAFAIDHIDKQERLNYLAYYDVLTGLANRSLFLDRLTQHIHSASNNGHKLAIGILDLERFKNINDSLGRTAGDSLLKQAAEWLTQFAQDANLLARIDADHFAFVVPEIKTDGNLAMLVENLMTAFQEHSFDLNDATFRIGIKIGIAVFPDDGDNVDTLYNNAEAALKKAKQSGDRYLFYTQKMTEAVADKLGLENQLRRAIDNEEFVLYYQPKVNLMSGKVTSAEALIRWNDPVTGLVPPGQFIPILEETGLIFEVGRWALRQAVTDWLRWHNAGLPVVRIAVNVSPLQLHSLNFIDELKEIISIDAEAAAGLELEITESLIMQDIEHSTISLEAIRALGMSIAIDDFGTGFSSLNYLSKLPVDTLKIDRSFVIEMDSPEGLALVNTIIVMAHALKLKVVAEGVETEQQMRQLLSLNCDEMQGFLFSKPVPADIFEARFLAPLTPGNE